MQVSKGVVFIQYDNRTWLHNTWFVIKKDKNTIKKYLNTHICNCSCGTVIIVKSLNKFSPNA